MTEWGYETALTSRIGDRARNEDRCAVLAAGPSVLLAVADGMGGHPHGDRAAQALVDTVASRFQACPHPVSDAQAFLCEAIEAAHHEVVALGQRGNPPTEPRTTCVVCVVQDGCAWWAHLGDSRLYWIRNGRVIFRTRDHTYLEDLYQQGRITREQMRTHPLRNFVTRCVGGNPASPHVPVSPRSPLEPGDRLLLCSDGLWSALEEGTMLDMLAHEPLNEALDHMAQNAQSATAPVSDNITVVCLAVRAPPAAST